jgi:hypothetical protein
MSTGTGHGLKDGYSRTPVLLQGWRTRSVWRRWAAAMAASWQATWSGSTHRCCYRACAWKLPTVWYHVVPLQIADAEGPASRACE